MSQKCVHKGCGKQFSDPDEECTYHPGPPVFHEGQKGWNCCKARVLTFDEFLSIPPCTVGKHSTVDDSPPPPKKLTVAAPPPEPERKPVVQYDSIRPPQQAWPVAAQSAESESDSDDPSVPVPLGKACRRRGCGASSSPITTLSRDSENCIHHAGLPIFHEGTKGWTCCKKRVLEFDEFMCIEGCSKKSRHLFVGSGKRNEGADAGAGEKELETVRHDYYQTGAVVHASLYLKKIKKEAASVVFSSSTTIDLDLPTADNTRYKAQVPLFGSIDTENSKFKILGTKLDLELVKIDGSSWPVFRADDAKTRGIIQTGKAGKV